eukprot:scaffold24687_cov104-Isochrysis_galbana.AAC.3
MAAIGDLSAAVYVYLYYITSSLNSTWRGHAATHPATAMAIWLWLLVAMGAGVAHSDIPTFRIPASGSYSYGLCWDSPPGRLHL